MYIHIESEKVDVFRKVLNKQFIERLKAIFIINKTQLHPSDSFTPWRDHRGDLNQRNKTLTNQSSPFRCVDYYQPKCRPKVLNKRLARS